MSQTEGNDGTAKVRRASGRASAGPHAALDMSDGRFDNERGLEERDNAEDRELLEDERLELFLETQHQTVLPNLPPMAGFHVCWLTTSNPRDSIQWRQSIGYELMTIDSCPQWRGVAGQIGGLQNCVCINEMVAARIPISLYNKLMRAVGHILPLREEEKVRAQTQLLAQNARERQIQVQEGDGTADIVQRAERPIPVFTE